MSTTETEVRAHCSDNPYTLRIRGNNIYYTEAFYLEMYRLSHVEGLTYVEAYERLGYDTALLGKRRAEQAGYRSIKYAARSICQVPDSNPTTGMFDYGQGVEMRNDIEAEIAAKERFLLEVRNKEFPFIHRSRNILDQS